MDRWGLICVLISNILIIIREVIKVKTNKVDAALYRFLTGLAIMFILLGIILYCFL